MGLWSSLFGSGDLSKNDLIRALAKQRIRQDPRASAMGFSDSMIDSLGVLQLTGLPESTIATIVETYAMLKKRGAPDHEILGRIEAHRSSIGSGVMPTPLNLESYTQYRVEIEHGHGAPISSQTVAEAVRKCRQHFGCASPEAPALRNGFSDGGGTSQEKAVVVGSTKSVEGIRNAIEVAQPAKDETIKPREVNTEIVKPASFKLDQRRILILQRELSDLVPGWIKIRETPEFKAWRDGPGRPIFTEKAGSWDPGEVASVFHAFEQYKCDAAKAAPADNVLSGGDGTSQDKALVVQSTNSIKGITAEYDYLTATYGQKDMDWMLDAKFLTKSNGRHYDVFNLKLKNGQKKVVYFDITNFFGRRG